MKVLVLGGTKFFGISMVENLLRDGHSVTVATRGQTPDSFGPHVQRIVFDHRNAQSVAEAFKGKIYDVVIDKIAYSSNDVRRAIESIACERYILTSTSGVYFRQHPQITEDEFDPDTYNLQWGERLWDGVGDFDYDTGKRQAECALRKLYPHEKSVMVRFPVVMGARDYTKRLHFYVEHVMRGLPMNITNLDVRISFIHESEAGGCIAKLLHTQLSGPVNGCSDGNLSVREIVNIIEQKTGRKALFSVEGDPAPYNGFQTDCTLSTKKAQSSDFPPETHELAHGRKAVSFLKFLI